MGKLLGNKIFVIGGSLVVLLALGVVLGLTIVRIQNVQPTVTQPEAASSGWPSCVSDQNRPGTCQGSDLVNPETGKSVNPPGGHYWCSQDDCFNTEDDSRNVNKCCSKVKNNPSACAWPARGWCTPDQCPGSGGERCGIYTYNSCSNCYYLTRGEGACYSNSDCGRGETCNKTTAKCTSNNPCWVNVPIPKDGAPQGTNASRTPTFSWTYDTKYSSDVKGTCVYLWSCAAKTDSCYIGAACGNGASFTSVDFSKFGKPSLAANTTYYWSITVNSYSPPDPKYACMPGYSFTTGSGGAVEVCWNDLDDNGDGNQDEGCVCPANACPSGKTCTSGKCTTSNNSCTVDSNCSGGQVCAEGSCVDPTDQHLICGQNATCVRKKGAGNNGSNCSSVGTSCLVCTKDSDCVSFGSNYVCSNNTCVVASTEVNTCWGNGGTNGKCYDCNGDGEVNILDFACFRAKYQQNVL